MSILSEKLLLRTTFFLTQTFWKYSFTFERAEEFYHSMAALTSFGSVVLFLSQASSLLTALHLSGLHPTLEMGLHGSVSFLS